MSHILLDCLKLNRKFEKLYVKRLFNIIWKKDFSMIEKDELLTEATFLDP
jgi:hypothetical protein